MFKINNYDRGVFYVWCITKYANLANNAQNKYLFYMKTLLQNSVVVYC